MSLFRIIPVNLKKINIVVGDSQYLVRSGLEGLINSQEEFKLLSEATTGSELVKLIRSVKPGVVILDYISSDFSLDVIRKIKQVSPEIKILVISSDLSRENIFMAIELGANSFVTKNCSEEEIVNAIIATSKNERFFCNRILEVFIDRDDENSGTMQDASLSNREIEILQLIGKGYSTKELAALLHLSHHTIYTHRKNMMKKLGVNSSTDMILTAVNMGLIKSTRKTG